MSSLHGHVAWSSPEGISEDQIVMSELSSEYAAFVARVSSSIPYFSAITPYMLDMHRHLWPEFSLIALSPHGGEPLGYLISIPDFNRKSLFAWQLGVPPPSITPLPAAVRLLRHVIGVAVRYGLEELHYTVRRNSAHQRYVERLLAAVGLPGPEAALYPPFATDPFGRRETFYSVKL